MVLIPPDERQYTCDGCESTVFSTVIALSKEWDWKRHSGGSGDHCWSLLLCRECESNASKPKGVAHV